MHVEQYSLSTLTVSQLNRQIRSWLEQDIGEVAVLGELSNLSKPSSGHFYFTLKDKTAQIKCVFFKNSHKPDSCQFENGQQVIASGKLSLYEARGDYQLIVQDLTAYGLGELYQQFELLKVKLAQQGLFAAQRKKALPTFPQGIGVITSASGAALHDILTTLGRRYPLATVYVYASEVQGKAAAPQLIHALKTANQHRLCQVIILARGGGSIEDLWAFNNENLALAISESTIPVISGVGHETDFTIADFVADFRAATPTAAAEAATPNQFELVKLLNGLTERMLMTMTRSILRYQMQLDHRTAKLSSPEHLVSRHWQTLDFVQRQLLQNLRQRLRQQHHRLEVTLTQLQAKNPEIRLQNAVSRLKQLEQRLIIAMHKQISQLKQTFGLRLSTLNTVSPLATLDRGYAIAMHHKKVLYNSQQVNQGDRIDLRLAHGQLTCEVL